MKSRNLIVVFLLCFNGFVQADSCLNVLIQANEELDLVESFELHENTSQHGGCDFANAIRVERGIPLQKAMEIALADPRIEYFFYIKGKKFVLPVPEGMEFVVDPLRLISNMEFLCEDGKLSHAPCRVLCRGDAVFFTDKEKMRLGTAVNLADTYVVVR